jgi:hypothetical protein
MKGRLDDGIERLRHKAQERSKIQGKRSKKRYKAQESKRPKNKIKRLLVHRSHMRNKIGCKQSYFIINLFILFFCCCNCLAQAEHEIQVYASPTIQKKATIFELHTNYTLEGSKELADPKSAHYFNATLEITRGITNNFELGFYIFTSIKPDGEYEYLGSHIRPRVTVPTSWNWPFGASLSMEFGIFRPDASMDFFWEGEIRPIMDKAVNNFYFSFNPNIGFALNGPEKHWRLSPQFKTVYTIKQKYGLGFEYYGSLGNFNALGPLNEQEHLLGPMIDLYIDPKWEFNAGFLFGLTNTSNQQILKLVLGRRIGL